MKSEARDIDKRKLAQDVAQAYGINPRTIEFLPRGEDAYTYVVTDRDGGRHFVRAQATGHGDPQESIYRLVHALHHERGLSAAVAPFQTNAGSFTFDHGRYWVAVFPFINGRTLCAQGASAGDLAQAATILAALHSIDAEKELPAVGSECFDNPFVEPILDALQAADRAVRPKDRHRRQTLDLLAAERDDVLRTLKRMDVLAENARKAVSEWVLTHGDPNLDNLLKDDRGRLFLTDWGELAVGPPERDLFMFTGEHFPAFLEVYVRVRGQVKVDADVLAFYLNRWCVQEIADYTTQLLFHDLDSVEKEHAWTELQPYLPVQHGEIAQGIRAARKVVEEVSLHQ